ncbi:hypothetical protein LC605_11900 [Nostoc sp. CHAB 5836]|uniref:hypothetical protein n=1 Tax=Nostoc sp. CHAB 5836 TaxID=2780404 RepID=UPI001E36922D|nr:hypothetical protein [Nostoc sp. CHAB 5836]MCC5615759.1 hypothetical protein [Nostoc sp. CHAB 5836]
MTLPPFERMGFWIRSVGRVRSAIAQSILPTIAGVYQCQSLVNLTGRREYSLYSWILAEILV